MKEKRSAPRMRSFLRGTVIFNNGQSTLDCLIRDISATGARLQLSEAVTLPHRFDLYVLQRRERMTVTVQWRRGDEVGVAVEQPDRPGLDRGVVPDWAERVRSLEAEVGRMGLLLLHLQSELQALKSGKAADARGDAEWRPLAVAPVSSR